MKLTRIANLVIIVTLSVIILLLARRQPTLTYTIHVHSPYDPDDAILVRFAGDQLDCFILD